MHGHRVLSSTSDSCDTIDEFTLTPEAYDAVKTYQNQIVRAAQNALTAFSGNTSVQPTPLLEFNNTTQTTTFQLCNATYDTNAASRSNIAQTPRKSGVRTAAEYDSVFIVCALGFYRVFFNVLTDRFYAGDRGAANRSRAQYVGFAIAGGISTVAAQLVAYGSINYDTILENIFIGALAAGALGKEVAAFEWNGGAAAKALFWSLVYRFFPGATSSSSSIPNPLEMTLDEAVAVFSVQDFLRLSERLSPQCTQGEQQC